MKKEVYRLCWTCRLFGCVLALLSFIISMNPNDWYMFYVGWFFVFVAIVGSIGIAKYKLKGDR